MATNKKYLSKEGLTHLVELIKNGTAAKDHTHDFSDLSGGIAHELSGEVIEQKLVNGNGSVKELTVYGATRQNLWVNPNSTYNGITVKANDDGSITVSGTATNVAVNQVTSYVLRPGETYTLSIDKKVSDTSGCGASVEWYKDDAPVSNVMVGFGSILSKTFTIPNDTDYCKMKIRVASGTTVSGTYRVMLNEGNTAEPWCPPGLNGVDECEIVEAGRNLWVNPSGTSAGVTVTANEDGTVTVSGTSSGSCDIYEPLVGLRRNTTYTISVDKKVTGAENNGYGFYAFDGVTTYYAQRSGGTSNTFATGDDVSSWRTGFFIPPTSSKTVSGTYKVMLNEGSEALPWAPPQPVTSTPVDLDGHTLNSLPDGTRDELRVGADGSCTLVQRVGVATAPTDAGDWRWSAGDGRASFVLNQKANVGSSGAVDSENGMCDKLPMRLPSEDYSSPSYTVTSVNNAIVKNPAITSAATAATVAGGATYLYPLAAPQEVELPGVSMPSVNADSITVFAASNVPTELDATIIDLPVVPISSGGTGATTASGARTGLDVYSKAEVDAKVGDAIDLPLAVSKGGTGAVTSLAANYNLLNSATQRASNTVIKDDTNTAFFTENPSTTVGALQKIPFLAVWNYIVAKIRSTFGFSSSNVLPVSHGGTGATTAKAAQNALLGNMNEVTTDSTDISEFVMCFTNPTDNNGAVCKRKAPYVWNWIKTKADAVYAAKSHTHTTHSTTNIAASTNLNTLQSPGWYYCSANATAATLTNCPTDNAFTLIVSRHAGYNQLLIEYMTSGYKIYARNLYNSTWGSWIRLYTTIDKPTLSEIGAAASSHDHSAANITSGTLPISRGGTGMTANPAMLVNLASASTANVFGSAPRPGVTGTLPVSHGGTGATAKGTTLLSNIGITISSSEAPATGTPGTIHIQLLD